MIRIMTLLGAVVVFALLPGTALADTIDLGPNPNITETLNPLGPIHVHPGPPTVVSVGDSAVSGEAGRWAGNTNGPSGLTDALGPHAYDDNATGTGEAIPGCHRSKSAEVHIGGGVTSVNFACSGAKTSSYTEQPSGNFKPGLDFENDAAGKGQAQMLQEYAAAHPNSIKAVVVLIGANDYQWASDVAATCVKDWAYDQLPPRVYFRPFATYCQSDPTLEAKFEPPNVASKTDAVAMGMANIHKAMKNAGYADTQYRIIAQTYSSPIPYDGGFRYPESGLARQNTGGCGIHNIDASWVNATVLGTINRTITAAVAADAALAPPDAFTNVDVLDATDAFVGHRLCEKGVGTLEETGVPIWLDARAVDASEWVQRIRVESNGFPLDSIIPPITPPYQFQENAHPNYWGQLALRNCFRQAYNNGAPHGGKCTFSGLLGLNPQGEPNMTLR